MTQNNTTAHVEKKDYSGTLNLPESDRKNPDGLDTNSTGIPLRANLPLRESHALAFWDKKSVYKQSLKTNTDRGGFILHDGPPYSNGDIHLGHSLNKILKDIIVKHRSMTGHCAPYIPGWDNHGLPIETAVTKEFREKKLVPTPTQLRARCREYASEYVERQKEQFKRLGVHGDWDNPYLTFSSEFEAKIVEVFGELVKDGYVYRGVKPVYWCPVDHTALADAEIEYENKKDTSIFLAFPLREDKTGELSKLTDKKIAAIAWTTTPWTIPANLALALNPNSEYSLIEHEDGAYLVATALAEKLIGLFGWTDAKTIAVGEAPAKETALGSAVFSHPLLNRASPIVFADYVTMEDGSGVVHTAPGHGREDFVTGAKYNLGVLSPVDASGKYTDEVGLPNLVGLSIWDGNKAVIELLEQNGSLIKTEGIEHSYPHCWRCHHPVIFRATAQWFMSIDHNGHREKCLDEIEKVNWHPKESINRIRGMVGGRPDWCLSRQRAWGVGIPVFYCNVCNKEVLEPETIENVRKLVLEHSSDIWFDRSAKDLLPDGYKCPHCGGADFEKESDIFDVWFDSGCTNRAVLESRNWENLSWPADVYLEGGDQHRGWFNSSLMIAVATKGAAPYRTVITNGWTLDEKGYKFSKSKGNGVAPAEVIKKFGADVLRLWVATSDYTEDLRVGPRILDQTAEMYRRLRNTLRFSLGNLFDFDPAADVVPYDELLEIDKYALHLLNQVVADAGAAFEAFEFHKAAQIAHQFCAVDMSAFYFDVLKDRLYAEGAKSLKRRSAQTVLMEITSVLARLLAPVLSFTSEEVWQKLKLVDKPESVLLAEFPVPNPAYANPPLAAKWTALLAVRDRVNKAIETAKQAKEIKKPLETVAKIAAPQETLDLLAQYESDLSTIFLVSAVQLSVADGDEITVTVLPATGVKCARCWLIKTDVNPESGICGRCADVVL